MLSSTKDLGPGAVLGQGVQQDERGRTYKTVFYPASKRMDRVIWTLPPLSPVTLDALTPVERFSKGYEAAQELEPKTPAQAESVRRILERGPVYTSLKCYENKEI